MLVGMLDFLQISEMFLTPVCTLTVNNIKCPTPGNTGCAIKKRNTLQHSICDAGFQAKQTHLPAPVPGKDRLFF
jgi:hypothetical protein